MPPLRLSVAGPVRLTAPDGRDHTPRATKARGALAVMAVARGMRVTRARLQDLLWSDRGPEQGMASLRQCLREIRNALGPSREALCAGPGWVGLDPAWIAVDDAPPDEPGTEFAEDLDIRDAEFEDWLRDTRSHFAARWAAAARAPAHPSAAGPGPLHAPPQAPVPYPLQAPVPHPLPAAAPGPGPSPAPPPLPAPLPAAPGAADLPALVVCDPVSSDASARVMAAMLLHEGAACAADLLALQVRGPAAAGRTDEGSLCLGALAHPDGAELAVLVTLRDGGSGRMLFTRHVRVDPARPVAVLRQEAGQIAVGILRAVDAGGPGLAARLPVRDVFSFSRDRLAAADAALGRVEEIAEPAVVWAMQAFLRNTMLLERLSPDPAGTIDEARAFSARALERAPGNPVVLAIAALIASRRRERSFAHELARSAVAADAGNGLARLALSQALTDIGRHAEADREAALARNGALAALGPATWLMRQAITSLREGRLGEAEDRAAAAQGYAPDYRPPLRMLAALRYRRGDEEGAAAALTDLRRIEPDFSLRLMASPDYPVATLKELDLLSLTRSPALRRAF